LKHTEEAKLLYQDLLKLDPNNINTLLELSKILSNRGDYDKALKLLSRAEKKSPDDSDLLLIKGTVYANKKDFVKAVEYLDRSLKLNPKNVYVWLNLGKIYVNKFNVSKSREYFEKGLELEPDNVFLLEGLGVSCLNLRLFNDAINKFERIIKLEPSYTSAYFYIAEAYKLKGDYDLSINYYDKLLELEPSSRSAILGKCNVYISSGKMPYAKKLFKKLMKESGGDAQVPFDISVVLNKCEKFKDSIRYLNKAIDTDSKREIFYIEKANIYHKLGKYKEADKSYKKALSINPKSSTVLYHIGINYLAKKNLRKAIEFLKKYTVIVPNDATAWFNLGTAYIKQGNKTAAKECFEYSIQYGPLNAEMFSVIGDFYNKTMGDFNNAIICYEKAISHGRSDSLIKIAIATCNLNIGKFDECIGYCKEVLNKEPENIDALVFESMAWSLNGRYDIPEEKLRKALLLKPNNYLTMLGLAIFNNNKRQGQEAIKWAKKGVEIEPQRPENVMLYLIIGNNYNLMGMYEEAIANLESAKKYKPDYEEVFKSGGFSFRNLKRYDEAIEWWGEYLKLKPDDWEYWYYTGVTYGDITDFKNGIECLEKAISLKDTEKAPYYALGVQNSKSGNHQHAIQIFQKLKALDSESNEPWLNTGDLYFNETNEFEKAIDEYLEAMKINSNNWKAWVNLSVASRILGNIVNEKEYIDKAIQLCPDKIELFLREINVYLSLDRITDAKRSVENAIIEFPENHIIWFLKACVSSLDMDVDESMKALEKAININRECINFALTEPNLKFLRTQKPFADLIEENR
ncbi:MAG: tetratricopeptide repeat protein, partial [Spirochaetes bacterium]|nr:tetratricopeptide repeat protein [Spirochaetota bacterium]